MRPVHSWLNTGLHPVLGYCALSGLSGLVLMGGDLDCKASPRAAPNQTVTKNEVIAEAGGATQPVRAPIFGPAFGRHAAAIG